MITIITIIIIIITSTYSICADYVCTARGYGCCFTILCHDPVSRSCVTILCHDPVSRYCVTILCHDPVSRSCVTILCHDPVSRSCFTILCHDPVSRSCVTILFHDPVSRSCVTILCHDPVSRYCVTILCHDPVSRSCVTILFHDPVSRFTTLCCRRSASRWCPSSLAAFLASTCPHGRPVTVLSRPASAKTRIPQRLSSSQRQILAHGTHVEQTRTVYHTREDTCRDLVERNLVFRYFRPMSNFKFTNRFTFDKNPYVTTSWFVWLFWQ